MSPKTTRRGRTGGAAARGSDGALSTLLGPHAVAAQLAADPASVRAILVQAGAGPRAQELAARAAAAGIQVEAAPRAALSARAGGRPHQGILATVSAPAPTSLATLLAARPNLVVALDEVQDPANLGAIMRSAWALGADGLVVPERRAAPLSPAALRAAAGAHAHLPTCRVVNLARALDACRQAGLWVVGLDAAAKNELSTLDPPPRRVLVVGGERRGLRPQVAARCDQLGAIAQRRQAGSLNASVAAGIALWALAGAGGRPG